MITYLAYTKPKVKKMMKMITTSSLRKSNSAFHQTPTDKGKIPKTL